MKIEEKLLIIENLHVKFMFYKDVSFKIAFYDK